MSMLRRSVMPIGAVAALLLIYLENPWLVPDGAMRSVVTLAKSGRSRGAGRSPILTSFGRVSSVP